MTGRDPAPPTVLVSDILSGLSHALDITEGHPRGHTARACLIGMRLARALALSEAEQADLFYALLLKDAGCSSNAARVHQLFGGNDLETKHALFTTDWGRLAGQAWYAIRNAGRGESLYRRLLRLGRLAATGQRAQRELFEIRCDRGAVIASGLGLSADTAAAIRHMDEHWDGGGQPQGLRGHQIPIAARIIGLAQVVEIFIGEHGLDAALAVARRRSGRWFDPELVRALDGIARDRAFWDSLRDGDERALVSGAEPVQAAVVADDDRLDRIAEAFAFVIDAKSPYTADHSRRVADFAVRIGAGLGLDQAALTRLNRAALLHDIGKLGVPNSILDKPSALTPAEWALVRQHPAYTFEILDRVPAFREFAFDASCHHEKLDGRGYHRGLPAASLTTAARVLAVADIADALLADRPYRPGLAVEDACALLQRDCLNGALCGATVSALVASLATAGYRGAADAPALREAGSRMSAISNPVASDTATSAVRNALSTPDTTSR